MHCTYDPAILFLGIYPQEMEKCIPKDLNVNTPSNFIHNSKKKNTKQQQQQTGNNPKVHLLIDKWIKYSAHGIFTKWNVS